MPTVDSNAMAIRSLTAQSIGDKPIPSGVVPSVTLNGPSPTSIFSGRVAGVGIPSGGSGYNSGTKINFTGGGGSGASGFPTLDSTGLITGIVMTATGSGYTSAPAAAIDNTTGGTGGSLTARIGVPVTVPALTAGAVDLSVFRYFGGADGLNTTGTAVLGKMNNGAETGGYIVEFIHDGSQLEIMLLGAGGANGCYRIRVDGAYVNTVPQPLPNDATHNYLLAIDFGGARAARRITFEVNGQGVFQGVNIGWSDGIWRSDRQIGPVAIFIGDSFTEPTITDPVCRQPINYTSWTGFASIAGQILGWDVWPAGQGGTGWSTTGQNNGSGGALTAIVSTSGVVTGITINSAGSGYSPKPPLLAIYGGGGIGAMAIATESSGGINSVTVTNGGSGYNPSSPPTVGVSGENSRFQLVDRIQSDIIAWNPAYVVICMGINDLSNYTSNPSNVISLITSGLAALKAGLPNATVFVVGPWSTGGSPNNSTIGIRDTLKAQALVNSFFFIGNIVATTSGVSTLGWMTGTGDVNKTTGIGNADVYTGTDGTHPTTAGHEMLGRRVAAAIQAAISGITS